MVIAVNRHKEKWGDEDLGDHPYINLSLLMPFHFIKIFYDEMAWAQI